MSEEARPKDTEASDAREAQWDWESPAPGIECGSSVERKGKRPKPLAKD